MKVSTSLEGAQRGMGGSLSSALQKNTGRTFQLQNKIEKNETQEGNAQGSLGKQKALRC